MWITILFIYLLKKKKEDFFYIVYPLDTYQLKQTAMFLLNINMITVKGSHIEVYSRIEFPKHDLQFNDDTKCCEYVAILHHSGFSYKIF